MREDKAAITKKLEELINMTREEPEIIDADYTESL